MSYLKEFRKRFEKEYSEMFDDYRKVPPIKMEKFVNEN